MRFSDPRCKDRDGRGPEQFAVNLNPAPAALS